MKLELTDFEAKLLAESLVNMEQFFRFSPEITSIPKDPGGSYMYTPTQRVLLHSLDVIDNLKRRIDLLRKQIEVSGLNPVVAPVYRSSEYIDRKLDDILGPIPQVEITPVKPMGTIRDYGQMADDKPATAKPTAIAVEECIAIAPDNQEAYGHPLNKRKS